VSEDRWYKNGLVYAVSVPTYCDSNGDGIGDLPGLTSRLDYLAGLGVSCLWLLPFYPSPWRDNGYDITDHYGVHPDFGNLGDFVALVHQAEDRGIRVIVDLVLNHTSDEHPWFQSAREGDPKFRDYYIWADRRPKDASSGLVFPGVQKTTWSYDRKTRRYYFHRFYAFQPDLNIDNPAVRAEMRKIIGFWAALGISGFRVDAVPFLIEPAGPASPRPGPEFAYLHELRNELSWRNGDAILLGEANVERDGIDDYFGVGGMHLLFNFLANQHLWLALARADASTLVDALRQTAGIPASDQWANFLRNHDEADLGRLTENERSDVFRAFAPKKSMQLYGRGPRRRLAPMLGGDRARLESALSLLLTLPGTPVLYYGDEIGMGEDLSLPERQAVRTAMQWTPRRNGGFSSARGADLRVPTIAGGPFGFRRVNVEAQQEDPGSLLSWLGRALRIRRSHPEFGHGAWDALGAGDRAVLALRYDEAGRTTVVLHNLAAEPRRADLRPAFERSSLRDVFANRRYQDERAKSLELDAFGYRWLAAAS
jgi:maltose alpha-D-glucosyltransferase / alpha-amylase